MSETKHVLAGLMLGALGALWHLGVVWMRARSLSRLGAAGALALAPLGWLGVGVAVLLAARIAPAAAWASLPGLYVTRALALRRAREGA